VSRILGQDKPSLTDLQHYGVLGMKWGKRKSASTGEIRIARGQVAAKKQAIRKQEVKTQRTASGSKARAEGLKKLSAMKVDFLKDPDRVISARMTRGGKFLAAGLGLSGTVLLGGALLPVAAAGAAIAVTSARSRRIEQKQDKNKYGKK
jgi:hypothetical protein